jgi:hypothetical protein
VTSNAGTIISMIIERNIFILLKISRMTPLAASTEN